MNQAWISVDDAMPLPPNPWYVSKVIGVTACNQVVPLIFEIVWSRRGRVKSTRWKWYDETCPWRITHWMPFPDPPSR